MRPCSRRRLSMRDTCPVVLSGRNRRRVLFFMPLMLNSPRAMAVSRAFVAGIEQVETGVGTALVLHRLREPVELVTAVARILDRGQELQVAAVGGLQDLPQ